MTFLKKANGGDLCWHFKEPLIMPWLENIIWNEANLISTYLMGGPRLAVLDEEEDDGEMALAESDWLKLLRLSSFSRVRSPSILAILGRDNKKYKNQCLVTPLRWWLIHSSIWSPAKHLMRGEDFVGHTWKMYKNVIMQWAAGLLKVGLSCRLSKKWKTSYFLRYAKLL